MRDLAPLDGDVVELDARGLLRDPGPRRLPHAPGVRRRPRRRVLAPRGAARRYEELHAAGGGILSTVRATRAAGEDGLRAAVERHAAGCSRHGTTTFEGKSGYGLDRETELASLRAIARRGRRPDVARRARGAARVRRRRRRVPRLRARRGAAGSGEARRGGRRLPRARRVRRRAGAPLPRGVPRRRASRCGCTATSSRSRARSRSRSSSARARSTTSRRRATTASARSPRATSSACCCPASALFLGRPMPPARALVDAGAAVALATDFNPGSAFTESLPLVCSLAATQLKLVAGGGARGVHGERRARPRPRRPASAGSRPATAPTSSCSTRPTGATSRTTSAATVVARRGRAAELALSRMPSRKQRRREQKAKRHEYEYVWVDAEGNELDEPPAEQLEQEKKSARTARSRAGDSREEAAGAAARAASRSRRRGTAPSSAPAARRRRLRALLVSARRGNRYLVALVPAAVYTAPLRPVHVLDRPLGLPALQGSGGGRRRLRRRAKKR